MKAVLRTLLVAGLLGGLGLAVFWRLGANDLRATIEQMEALQKDMERRLAAREAMLERLNRNRRLAHLHVVDQAIGPAGVLDTDLLFIELDESGREIARQQFNLPGDVVFVDALSVKFHQDDVASGHPLRGRTLLLLRRIYSDRMAPVNGYPIDTPGAVPPGYAAGEAGRFEKRIWEHFWELATDPAAASAMGIRVAQGEAVYKPVEKGRTYELIVDAVGGMSLTPLPDDVASASPR